MLVIRGVYDGEKILPLEDIPIKNECDVIITFINKTETKTEPNIDPIKALRGCSKGNIFSPSYRPLITNTIITPFYLAITLFLTKFASYIISTP